ncbi:hypothetical protein Nepgr_025279 [Nepenthes gracilis]|uniref:Uncharacterized protein n=1 Tax=Nepenthes gracilis TaxID=150966 RepID=A0AAD3T7I1_NEPGR|nr:hypothetical protein Nepgr_025279 [Nepenthes gracilis]
MEMDFWASRVHSAKQRSALLGSHNHFPSSDSGMNEDPRTYFTCPFCYVDIELNVLCSHLQEEHCFNVKNAVCPVCALNLGKDVIGHFKVHHANSLKSRRKSQKPSFWSSTSVRELSSFYGSTTRSVSGNAPDSSPDPLLSPFLSSIPYLEPKSDPLPDTHSSNEASITLEPESLKPSPSNESHKEDTEERRQRAEFFQELILSTIF